MAKNFASLTIDCPYLYFGMCTEILTKEYCKWSQFMKTRILLLAEISQFRVYWTVHMQTPYVYLIINAHTVGPLDLTPPIVELNLGLKL